MVMDGLAVLVCASALLAAEPTPARPATTDDRTVTATLAVQAALEQGKQLLLRGDFRAAVYVLEGQLAHINGNRAYLRSLQDAYRGLIKELRLAKENDAAEVYVQRLRCLDPGVVLDTLARPSAPAAPANDAAKAKVSNAAPPKPAPIVRAQGGEDTDPFHKTNALDPRKKQAGELVARAEQEFGQKRYREALQLFQQAHQTDQQATEPSRTRWAYCKLHTVVELLNANGAPPAWPELEREVRSALDLAPNLEYGKQLLAEIAKRKGAGVRLAVQHAGRNAQGWQQAETTNFRVFHNQSRELAEQVAQVAEETRVAMQQKWFGGVEGNWQPKCDIYLHANGQEYGKVTGVSGNLPGHSTMRFEGGRFLDRRIDLNCQANDLVKAVLPHETTHVVLAGRFGDLQVPRWADEGMAVLTEPRVKVEQHLRQLNQARRIYGVQQLMTLNDYPDPQHVGVFYAQSVSLVDFLTTERGPQTFTAFLRDGLRGGYEAALQRHYGFRSFKELDERWYRHAFGTEAASTRDTSAAGR